MSHIGSFGYCSTVTGAFSGFGEPNHSNVAIGKDFAVLDLGMYPREVRYAR